MMTLSPLRSVDTTRHPGQLGRRSGLADEDQAVGVEVRLGRNPRRAATAGEADQKFRRG